MDVKDVKEADSKLEHGAFLKRKWMSYGLDSYGQFLACCSLETIMHGPYVARICKKEER